MSSAKALASSAGKILVVSTKCDAGLYDGLIPWSHLRPNGLSAAAKGIWGDEPQHIDICLILFLLLLPFIFFAAGAPSCLTTSTSSSETSTFSIPAFFITSCKATFRISPGTLGHASTFDRWIKHLFSRWIIVGVVSGQYLHAWSNVSCLGSFPVQ